MIDRPKPPSPVYDRIGVGYDRTRRADPNLAAEIARLLRAQHPGHRPRELHPALFEKTRVDPRLPPARQQLYAAATRYAARFCARLESALLSNRPVARHAAVAALRRFYRLGCTRKLRHIEQLGGRMHDTVAA